MDNNQIDIAEKLGITDERAEEIWDSIFDAGKPSLALSLIDNLDENEKNLSYFFLGRLVENTKPIQLIGIK